MLIHEFLFSDLSSGVGVGFIVWYGTGGAVGGIGCAVGGVPGAFGKVVIRIDKGKSGS